MDETAEKAPFSPRRLWPLAVLAGGITLFFLLELDSYLSFESLRENRAFLSDWVAANQLSAVPTIFFSTSRWWLFRCPAGR